MRIRPTPSDEDYEIETQPWEVYIACPAKAISETICDRGYTIVEYEDGGRYRYWPDGRASYYGPETPHKLRPIPEGWQLGYDNPKGHWVIWRKKVEL